MYAFTPVAEDRGTGDDFRLGSGTEVSQMSEVRRQKLF
jgi:hypothetical protein